jgi:hypothetical protein
MSTAPAVLGINEIARRLSGTRSLAEAERLTVTVRGTTELVHERRKAEAAFSRSGNPPDPSEQRARAEAYFADAEHRGVSLITFRRLAEVTGMRAYEPAAIRALAGPRPDPRLPLCYVTMAAPAEHPVG